jgi:hypothetical protein
MALFFIIFPFKIPDRQKARAKNKDSCFVRHMIITRGCSDIHEKILNFHLGFFHVLWMQMALKVAANRDTNDMCKMTAPKLKLV